MFPSVIATVSTIMSTMQESSRMPSPCGSIVMPSRAVYRTVG
jgi:hypothetical protein